jgi:hypothetical protein
MLRSGSPALIAQEHAAWIISAELARATARAAAMVAVPARKGSRAGQPVHSREISFTAARRAIIATTSAGAATASLPAGLTSANIHHTLTALARRRVQADRDRHRERNCNHAPTAEAPPDCPARAWFIQALVPGERHPEDPGRVRPGTTSGRRLAMSCHSAALT